MGVARVATLVGLGFFSTRFTYFTEILKKL